MWQLELAKGSHAQLSGCCRVGRTRAIRATRICNIVGIEQLTGRRLCPVMQSKQKQKKMGLSNHGLSRVQKHLWNCPARRWCTPCSPACSSCPVGAHSVWWCSVGTHWGGRVLPDQRKWLLLPSRQVTATMPAAWGAAWGLAPAACPHGESRPHLQCWYPDLIFRCQRGWLHACC